MRKGLIITPRDRKLMEGLARYGLLTTNQIHWLFFREVKIHTVLRRLRKLKGHIELKLGLNHGHRVWTLTAKGANLIGADLMIKSLNRNTLEHDTLINDIRIRLKEFSNPTSCVPGFVLKHKADQTWKNSENIVPDGIFNAQSITSNQLLPFCLE